jgi:hypothetical protein
MPPSLSLLHAPSQDIPMSIGDAFGMNPSIYLKRNSLDILWDDQVVVFVDGECWSGMCEEGVDFII